MYLRLLRLHVSEDRLEDLQRFYQERVVPVLRSARGCLYASLLQPGAPGGVTVSLTIWRNAQCVREYENGPLFAELVAQSSPISRSASGTAPASRAAAASAEGYDLLQDAPSALPASLISPHLHVRVVNLRVQEGKSAHLADHYRNDVAPALMALRGCVGAFLAEADGRPRQALSVTFWERDEDAIRYELSGAFDSLTAKLQDSLSNSSLWKQILGAASEDPQVTSGDLRVERFTLVAGALFQP